MITISRQLRAHLSVAASLLLSSLGTQYQLLAQAVPTSRTAASLITARGLQHRTDVLARDSMRGSTPSPGLERTARYVATQFATSGFTPELQRFSLPDSLLMDFAASKVALGGALMRHGVPVVGENGFRIERRLSLAFENHFRPAMPRAEFRPVNDYLSTVLVAGQHTARSVREANIGNEINVVYVPPIGIDTSIRRQVIDELYGSRLGRAVVVLEKDSAVVAHHASMPPLSVVTAYALRGMHGRGWAVYASETSVAPILKSVFGVDVKTSRMEAMRTVRPLPRGYFTLVAAIDTTRAAVATVPNVVAVLEGSDPVLKHQYVVFSAHMDKAETFREGATMADDVASIAGLIELANAFRQAPQRPRRSLVFLASSGGAPGIWGSTYFVNNHPGRIVFNFDLGKVARPAEDSVVLIGLQDVELSRSVNWIVGAHPELGLRLVDGGTISRATGDQLAFVRRAVPSLSIVHERPGQGPHSATGMDVEHVVRLLRFAFYVGQEVADAEIQPRWTGDGRTRQSLSPDP